MTEYEQRTQDMGGIRLWYLRQFWRCPKQNSSSKQAAHRSKASLVCRKTSRASLMCLGMEEAVENFKNSMNKNKNRFPQV